MQKLMKEYLNELKKQQKRRRKVSIAVVLLVTLVVGTVTNGLTRYGSAMTGDTKCGLEEHQHSNECYQDVLICGYGEDTEISSENSVISDTVSESEENTTSDVTSASEPEENTKLETDIKPEEKAVTTKEILTCGQKEQEGHQHTDDCYEEKSVLDCTQEEGEGHQHSDSCYEESSTLDCAQEESEGHQHGDSCYETESTLNCDQEENEEHTHDDSCYTSENILTCDQEESEGHQHDDSCYKTESALKCEQEEREGHQHNDDCYKMESVLKCEQEEREGHTHSDDCYTIETIEEESESSETTVPEDNGSDTSVSEVKPEGESEPIEHTHTDDCYERRMVCELEEHTHTDDCLIDHNADVEDASDWDAQYADVEWTDAWGEDLVTAAKMQLDYQESLDNYQVAEDGSHKGYSRYGDFAGDAYADWDAAFVNFCIHYAGLPDEELFPDKIDTNEWYKTFVEADEKNQEYLTAPEDYLPVPGDLIFFESKEDDNKEMRIGIVSSYEEGETEGETELKVIEGNSDNAVKENTYAVDDSEITEYLKISEMEKVYKDRLSEEEQAQVDAVIALIEALPTQEEVTARFAALEEAENQDEYKTYYLELLEQVSAAREAYEALSEKQKAAVTNVEKLLQYEWLQADTMEEEGTDDIPDFAASIPVDRSTNGKMVLELRYGQDKKRHDELKAQVQSPHYELVGYFDLYTRDIEGDMALEDLKVTLHIPKQYIDKNSLKFVKIPQSIEHEFSEVIEDDDYYNISVTFPNYRQTGQMQYEFDMRFLGGIVPADYDLKIYATISCGEVTDDTKENIYKPKYELPRFVKYVNTNQYDSMAQDYTRVSASVDENGMIVDNGYVSFWYKMGGDPITGTDGCFYREYDKVTLTDILPTYKKYVTDTEGKIVYDENGNPKTEMAIAVFDASVNPGWELSEDKTEVSKVIETEKSCLVPAQPDEDGRHWRAAVDLQKRIQETELKLQFPGCVIDEKAGDNFLKKDLKNTAKADCHPHNPSEGEKNDVLNDDLIFTLTSQPTGAGFSKYNSANVIMDTQTMRKGLYRWGINFENEESTEPLSNIILKDYELDTRLKIRTLRLETENKVDYQAKSRIEYIEAITYDGVKDSYTADQFSNPKYEYGWGHYQELVLEENKEYKEFIIYMKEDYVLELGKKIHIGVYTTFREPDKRHYINEGKDSPENVYHNGAMVEYNVQNTNYTIVSGNQFSLIDTNENIGISKEILGESVELGTKDKYWMISVKGSLADGKDYKDMRIIDLLPEPFQLPKDENGEWKVSYGVGGNFVRESKVIENYKNTGRTAVILYLNTNEVKKVLDASDGEKGVCILTLKTEVPMDARVGLFTNEAWLLSDDFENVTTQSSGADIYDLDGDGDKEELIRLAKAGCTIKAPAGIYAEKFIAPADKELWRTKDLFLGVGDVFRYKLSVVNAADQAHNQLLVYDVLPRIGDKNISNSGERGSEYTVQLSDKIGPIEGYKVYYTTSEKVYQYSMQDILGSTLATSPVNPDSDVEWLEEENVDADTLKQITAFKIVADEGTIIPPKGRAEFVIPSKVTDILENDSYKILHEKQQSTDRESGTATYLISTNSFGYCVGTFSGNNLESNYVRAQIPFAGFVVKKVDASETDKVLSGAEFKLEKLQSADTDGSTELTEETWEMVAQNGTDENGILSFRDLTEGTYRLIETKAPTGYNLNPTPIPVEIHLDRDTMEYKVTIDGNDHAGNSKDPFVITNQIFYELPSTGGMGAEPYAVAGTILMMAAFGILYRRKGRAEVG